MNMIMYILVGLLVFNIISTKIENEEDKYTFMHISFICTNKKLESEFKSFTEVIDKMNRKEENYFRIINKIIAIIMETFFNKLDSQIMKEYLEMKKGNQEKNIICPKISNIDIIFQNLSIENGSLTFSDREKDFLEFYFKVQIFSEDKYKKERKIYLENEEKLNNQGIKKKSFYEMTWGEALYAYKLKILAFSILIGYIIYSTYFRKPDLSFLKPKNEILQDDPPIDESINREEKGRVNSEPPSTAANTTKHKVD